MGIEDYFKKADTGKTPAARKRKPTEKSDDDDDFQEPKLKSKHFASTEKKTVDPKDFFSSKLSASKSKVSKATNESKNVNSKTATTNESKAKEPKAKEPKTKETKAKETKAKETKAKDVKKPVASKKTSATKRKLEDEDDFEGNEEDDEEEDDYKNDEAEDDDDFEEEEEEPVCLQKKAKKATSPPPPTKKTPSESTAQEPKTKSRRVLPTAKPTDNVPIKQENEPEEEKPKTAKKNYFAMMKSVEGPKALGTRPEPVGAPNCFDGCAFVISGQYETLTREQTQDIIKRHGGRVTGAVSGKTTYLLRGRDAGESKLAKAKSLGTKILDEDEFYQLVENSVPKKASVPTPSPAKEKVDTAKPSPAKGKGKTTKPNPASPSNNDQSSILWTEKYKPTELKEIIGNKELVNQISQWLAHWQENAAANFDGTGMQSYRALLLSGPPGIGKTTTANVVARINGYEALEFNASDVRSKKILEESISEMMDNRTMTEFFQSNEKQENRLLKGKKVVLIMDEVDGMSAGDRGGSAELAKLIRATKIPVICICNDSRSQKVAPLLRVCYEAKFRRSTAAQIRSRILSIAYKEKLNISPNAIDELVAATQNDIRQIINILSTYRLKETDMSYDQAKTVGKNNQKHSILGLFDIPSELLSAGNWRNKSLSEKYEVYFHDYSLSHLMIQENYLKCSPERARSETGNPNEIACNEMDLFAQAAEAIADGDLVDTMIHGTVQHWSLMPVHSIFSCVRPSSYIRGGVRSQYGFPGWLGQFSKAGKYARQLSDVQTRMRIKASGDKFEIRQNYVPTLNDRIFSELSQENYDEAMEIMDTYYLDRESLDTLNDLTFAPSGKGPLAQLPTKTKTTLTRTYNARKHPILFQISGVPIRKSVSGPKEDAVGLIVNDDKPIGDDLSEEEEEEYQDPTKELSDVKYIKEKVNRKRKADAPSGRRGKRKIE
ncbi:hypothetical protein CU098_011383 [Rhizopus stolonifer]|uniref:Replication factor C subunit 1 n=1 Tax=Rhizopus stolonifer TaxID=4846 RepID=A0A367KPD7_RHIST|nr:hypothetical protein CU098_011383 [Rhizopus stolonifer]